MFRKQHFDAFAIRWASENEDNTATLLLMNYVLPSTLHGLYYIRIILLETGLGFAG